MITRMDYGLLSLTDFGMRKCIPPANEGRRQVLQSGRLFDEQVDLPVYRMRDVRIEVSACQLRRDAVDDSDCSLIEDVLCFVCFQ